MGFSLMVEIYRTPDVAFDGLDDFAFKPNYIEWEGLRTHFIDEGPRDGPVATGPSLGPSSIK